MKEIEMERVYLLKKLPDDLNAHKAIIIKVGDFFEPNRVDALKLRQKGDKFELIKKEAKNANERSENRIDIIKGEFEVLWQATTQKHEKIRVFYSLGKFICEIDLYKGKLDGYVRAEVEFKTKEELEKFEPPAWFGKEITELNHEIHKDLGLVSFKDMAERFAEREIKLLKLNSSALDFKLANR